MSDAKFTTARELEIPQHVAIPAANEHRLVGRYFFFPRRISKFGRTIMLTDKGIPNNGTLKKDEVTKTDEFAKLVEKCRLRKLTDVIENTSMEHATILLRNLFSHADTEKSDIQIVSGRLLATVYEPIIPELKKVLNSNRKVEAIVFCNENELQDNQFYLRLVNHHNGTVHIADEMQAEDRFHFFVTDNAYRLEVDDVAKRAYASFNDEHGLITEFLRDSFEDLKKKLKGKGTEGWQTSREQQTD